MTTLPSIPDAVHQSRWYYADANNQPQGPYSREDLDRLAEEGVVTPDTPVIAEGGVEWCAYRQTHPPIPPVVLPPPLAPASGEPVPPPIPRTLAPPTPPAMGNNGTECILASRSEVLGVLIMLLPLASAVLIFFWIGSMSLIQNPGSTLTGLMVLTVIATSILMAVEASQLGMGRPRNGKATTRPAFWFLIGLLFWCVALPAYLYSRRKYGVKNYLVWGISVVLIFLGVGIGMSVAIEQQKAEVRQRIEDASEQLRDVGRQFQDVR